MQRKLKVNLCCLQKAAVCLAFFGFVSLREACASGAPPSITVPPLGLSVQNGGTIVLTATIGLSLTPLTVRWYCNNNQVTNGTVANLSVPIVGTTISTLTITNASASDAGNYYVKAENGGGEVKSANAIVVVLGASNLINIVNLLPSQCGMTNGGFHLQLFKPASSNCVVEATSDYVHWTPIYTNNLSSTNISWIDSDATNHLMRYYRARLQ
jgi:hypothetical protein